MRASTGLGFAIAAVVACVVLGFSLFGDRHEDWMLRAARCMNDAACTRIDAKGELVRGTPLTGVCTKASQWQAVLDVKKHAVPFVVMCSDGASYLFHMGKFRNAGQAQAMVCAEAGCAKEVRLLGN